MTDKIKERGLDLAMYHKGFPELEIIKQVDSDEWFVKNYLISYDYDEGFECSCPYNQHKGECKHIYALKVCRKQGIFIPLM